MQNARIIRRPEVQYMTGRGRSYIYSGMADGTFPKNIRIGKRSVGWIESEIQKWVQDKIEESKKKQRVMAEAKEQDKVPQQKDEEEAEDVAA